MITVATSAGSLAASSSTMSFSLYAVVAAVLGLILHQLSKIGRRPAGYPPGPPTLPIIGNLHLMPSKQGHLQFQKWADEYGPVYSLILGTKVMIVLSSDQAIKDLLDKRSHIYSSRPDMHIGQVVSGGLRMLLMVSCYCNHPLLRVSSLTVSSNMAAPGGYFARLFITA